MNMYEFKNLNYVLGDKKFSINNINISALPGIIYLDAPNGYGKSMFINILSSILKPVSGKLISNIKSNDVIYIADSFIDMSEQKLVNNLKWIIKDVYGVKYSNIDIDKTLNELNIYQFKKTKAKELSKGTRQKSHIFPLFYPHIVNSTKLIIIDEIFVGLDTSTQQLLINQLVKLSKTHKLILIEHSEHIKNKINCMIDKHEKIIISAEGEYEIHS